MGKLIKKRMKDKAGLTGIKRKPEIANNTRPFLLFIIGALLAGAVVIFSIIGFVLAGYFYFQISGRILPNIHAADIDLGMMTKQDAAVELHKRWALDQHINITDGATEISLLPHELGLYVDSLRTAEAAYQHGRQESILSGIGHMFDRCYTTLQQDLYVTYDQEKARAALIGISPLLSKRAKDATFFVEGTELIAIPSEPGYTINVDETLKALETNPIEVLSSGELHVVLMPVTPKITDVTGSIDRANRLLSTNITIYAYDPISGETLQVQLPKEVLAGWLIVKSSEEGPIITLDTVKIKDYLNQFGNELGEYRWIDGSKYSQQLHGAVLNDQDINVVINHTSTTYEVKPGDTLLKIGWNAGIPFWMIQNANPDLDPNAIRVGQVLAIPSKDELLPLPVVPHKRIVISISKQKLWAYENGELLSKHVISTGINRSPTQPGVFQVQTHEKKAYASVWDLYMPHFLGIYEAWPGFMNGIHGLPTLSSGQRLWANILGKPASYGCIIMKLDAAEWLFNWAENGVVVEILP